MVPDRHSATIRYINKIFKIRGPKTLLLINIMITFISPTFNINFGTWKINFPLPF